MFCNKCGMQLNEGSVFCPRCGVQVAAAARQVAPTEEVSPKSRLATTLLACPWLVVGIFGAHRFYVGKIKTAVAMLLLGLAPIGCVLLAVLTVILGALTVDGESESMPPVLWAAFLFYGLAYASAFAAGIWSLVDFIFAVSGNFKDAQGRPIKTWEH